MTDVQPRAAGVGEHVEHVSLGHVAGFGGIEGGERLVLQPIFLPLLFNGGEVVAHGGDGTDVVAACTPFHIQVGGEAQAKMI